MSSLWGLSTIMSFLLTPLGHPAPMRGSVVDEASVWRKPEGLDSLTESLCAVDNDLIKESIRTEARPCPATLDLSQPRFPARGKNSFWIPSALLMIKSICCHLSKRGKTREHKLAPARKTDVSQRTVISAYSASGHQMLAARKKRNI